MSIKKALWFAAGMIFLGIAFVGIYLPMLPWSTPTVIAAYCFAKSSKRMHDYLYNHKLFGPFLTGWAEKRIFPTKFKYFMLVTMSSSVAVLGLAQVILTLYYGAGVLWRWSQFGPAATPGVTKNMPNELN